MNLPLIGIYSRHTRDKQLTKETTMAKLNENDISNILLDHYGYGVSAKGISEAYGISVSHARKIIKRQVWKDVTIAKK